ncbi:MAG: TetR/AcrR family transcriptional regulator [Actinobacteria bacterium]|nr:TetR/AcrR family transcriptional regulator [Actinomycetota bacterium]
MAQAATARGQRRREAIVAAATDLFDEQGFHGTSIDDIGAAAGISGPGLYRHFEGKDAILTAVFDRIWERLRPVVATADSLEPTIALASLVDAHVDLALEDAAALMLLSRELRHVPEDYQRLAARNHGRYVDAWAGPIRRLHPSLSVDASRAVAVAAHGLIDSAARRPRMIPTADRRELLRRLALDVVLHLGHR